ncbi:MAG: hypothetical protein NVS4B1_36620 [Ktedonobacteraceae bacterium]
MSMRTWQEAREIVPTIALQLVITLNKRKGIPYAPNKEEVKIIESMFYALIDEVYEVSYGTTIAGIKAKS